MRFTLLLSFVLFSILLFGCAQQAQAPPSQPGPPGSQNQIPPTVTNTQNTSQQQPTAGSSLSSKEISYYSEGWTIYGTLYQSKNSDPKRVIILVHELGRDRNSWPASFISRLHDEFPDSMVLAIDLRGQGKSTALGSWRDLDVSGLKDSQSDIFSADKYFSQNYPTVKDYYVIGASFGSTAGILAADRFKEITKVVMISPGMSYQGVSIDQSFKDYPLPLFVASGSDDTTSAQAVSQIYSLTGASQTTMKVYQGTSAHGTDLFAATEVFSSSLSDDIIQFLKS